MKWLISMWDPTFPSRTSSMEVEADTEEEAKRLAYLPGIGMYVFGCLPLPEIREEL